MKIKTTSKYFVITCITLLSAVGFGQFASGASGEGPNPYSDCGIGAALFPNTSWAAVSSNVIWDVGSTAVTSATASPDTCTGSDAATAQFIFDTYDSLVGETSKGSGEYLTAMLNIYGCAVPTHNEVIYRIRSQMTDNVASVGYIGKSLIEKSSDYYDVVKSAASNSCS